MILRWLRRSPPNLPARQHPARPVAGPALAVDTSADRHAISPLIYGMNFADEALRRPGAAVQRWGGNATTRYNWQNDTSNRASDWFFENIPNENAESPRCRMAPRPTIRRAGPQAGTPNDPDHAADRLDAQKPRDHLRLRERQVRPAAVDRLMATGCGNGITPDGSRITGNDPTDTSMADRPGLRQRLDAAFGQAVRHGDERRRRFYNLDNEPMLWHDTHRDVHPTPASYDEMRDRTYAVRRGASRRADPSAQDARAR